MAKKPAKKNSEPAIVEREPVTISELATILELTLTKLNGAIKDCSDGAVKKVLQSVSRNLSEIIEADIVLSLRPIDNIPV